MRAATRRRPKSRRALLATVAALTAAIVCAYAVVSFLFLNAATTATRLPNEKSPSQYGLEYTPIQFESADDRIALSGWIVPAAGDRAILMIHGLDSNRSDGVNLEIARAFVDRGFTVLMYDSRANGESGNASLGLGWFERRDVRAAVDQLLARGFRSGKIGIYGASYGAAGALLATAAIPEAGAVVADSAFADARELLDTEQQRKTGLPPIFTPGISFWFQVTRGVSLAEIAPIRAVPSIAPRPIFFIHGGHDARIPWENSQRLRAASTNPADQLWIIPNAAHAEGYRDNPALYLSRVTGFFEQGLR